MGFITSNYLKRARKSPEVSGQDVRDEIEVKQSGVSALSHFTLTLF
jgi:hypothetical protein